MDSGKLFAKRASSSFGVIVGCAICLLARVAPAQQSPADLSALKQVLNAATFIARGHPISSEVRSVPAGNSYQYVRFELTEILKGTSTDRAIEIRQPAPTEGSDSYGSAPGEIGTDVILVLGVKDATDGSYAAAAAFSNGTYTIESDAERECVRVNDQGVDADSVAPKDVHRKTDNACIPIELFRQMARSATTAAPVIADSGAHRTPAIPPAISTTAQAAQSSQGAPADVSTPPRAGESRHAWRALAAALAVIAGAVWIVRRTSTSRSK